MLALPGVNIYLQLPMMLRNAQNGNKLCLMVRYLFFNGSLDDRAICTYMYSDQEYKNTCFMTGNI